MHISNRSAVTSSERLYARISRIKNKCSAIPAASPCVLMIYSSIHWQRDFLQGFSHRYTGQENYKLCPCVFAAYQIAATVLSPVGSPPPPVSRSGHTSHHPPTDSKGVASPGDHPGLVLPARFPVSLVASLAVVAPSNVVLHNQRMQRTLVNVVTHGCSCGREPLILRVLDTAIRLGLMPVPAYTWVYRS